MDVRSAIEKHKIIAILRRVPGEKILPVVQALYDGGIRLIEVTYDQNSTSCLEDTGRAIAAISERFGDRVGIGAGTVITKAQVENTARNGGRFVISPNTDPSIIKKTVRKGMVSIPGALTPSEIVAAYHCGAAFVKIFPAGEFGVSYIKAVKAPIAHIPLIAVGGINVHNISEYLAAGYTGVAIGSNIAITDLIMAERYDKLVDLAKEYTSRI
ncbi:MAG: bifunctional 4-hydroxy-2-oxoglutarate aldolase/2-dehydro-3-deoxy-phosphogluconate aldolase [Clostridiales Family XIII bacterium]|jgi:2-dehydro-3-deoxyphosphogluconate aldolase/(4S)-4-hydroxy-2-oxoglutarate aldolase|nr:bifunctional 4-hydroxy-2-oxoglutarate aldolase/2-dehydro-3-deoxy-phosphogluconate aldolase [Clostridiales Family XIII bacterium]